MIPYDLLAKAKTMEAVERSVIVRDCGEQRTDETQKIFKPVEIDICHYTSLGGSDGKVSAHNVGDLGSIPGPGRSHGEVNGTPLQYSCLENSMN